MRKRSRVWLLGMATVLVLVLLPSPSAMANGVPHDGFAEAGVLGPLPASVSQTTAGASRETGEPAPGIGSTVWFGYTPAVGGTLQANTAGSIFDTILCVYTGSGLTTLSEVICNDDAYGYNIFWSSVVFDVTAGTTYWFQAGGWANQSGALTFNLVSLTPVDTTAPVITPTVVGTLGLNGWYTSDVTVSWTVSDPESAVTATTDCGSTTVNSDTAGVTLTCSATSAGGTSSSSVTITRDVSVPAIAAALTPTAAGSGWWNVATGAPTVSFTCSDATSGLAGPCPGDHLFGEGENQAYGQTVHDNAGNSASAGVNDVDVDLTAPTITAALTPTAAGSGWWNVATGAPTVTYTCLDGLSGVASCTPVHLFGEGVGQSHTGTAVDGAGNSATASVSDVDVDLTAPVVGVHAPIVVEASGPSGAVVPYTNPTATDTNPVSPVVSCVPASGSTFPLGGTTVTCSASDAAGDTGRSTFTVTVADTTAPMLTLPGAMTVEATGPSGAVVWFVPSAWDVVGPASPVVFCTPAPGSTFPLGTTTVDCAAMDAAGNTRLGSFTVTVRDATAPVVSVPANLTVEATGPAGAVVNFAVTAADLVDPSSPAVTCLPPSGSTFPLGATTVTCSAPDAAGNTGTASFTITVRDTAAPVIALLGDSPILVPAGSTYADAGARAADLVDGDLTGSIVTVNPVDTSTPGIYAVTYDVTDSHANAAVRVTREVRVAYFCGGREATVWGTEAGGTLMGTAGADVIVGLGGDDIIFGLGGDDLVCGGGGDDILYGGDGDDRLWGGAGDDRLAGGKGDDRLGGGPGIDSVDYSGAVGPMVVNLLLNLATGEGADRLRFVENAIGSRRADLLIGGSAANTLWGNDGDDELRGGGGDDILWGDDGDDHLLGNGGDDWLWGGAGHNLLDGGLGNDTLDDIPE